MPSLNIDLNYFEHPKTRRLVGIIGKCAEVFPIKLWAYCGKYHSEDGRLTGYSEDEIESIIGWEGRQGELINALVKIGFLENDGEWFIVHQWQEYEGHIYAYKAKAEENARKRWGQQKHATSNAPSNAPSNALAVHGSSCHCSSCQDSSGQSNKVKVKDSLPSPKPATPRAKKEPTDDHSKLMNYFSDKFTEVIGQKPVIHGGKEGKAAKSLLTIAGITLEEIQRGVDWMLTGSDDWTRDHAELTLLFSHWNQYLASKRNGGRPLSKADELTRRNLESGMRVAKAIEERNKQ